MQQWYINYLVLGNCKLKHSLREQMLRNTEWTGLSLPKLQKPNPKPELRQTGLNPPPCWQGADFAHRSDNNSFQDYLRRFPSRFPSSFVFGAKHPSPQGTPQVIFCNAYISMMLSRCSALRPLQIGTATEGYPQCPWNPCWKGCGKHRYCSLLPNPEEGRHPPKVSLLLEKLYQES